MIFFLIILVVMISSVQAFFDPEWIKKVPASTSECEFVVGEGEANGSKELDIMLASKRSLHDGHVKILKKMDLSDFEHEVKLNLTSDQSDLDEVSVENYPRIGSKGINVQETYKENTTQGGVIVYSLICFDRSSIRILEHQKVENRPVHVEIDSMPSAPEVVINGRVMATPALFTFVEGQQVLVRFRYSKDKNKSFEYTAKIEDDMKRKIFQLDVSTQDDKYEPEREVEVVSSRVWSEVETKSEEHLGINWDLEYGYLSKTIKKGGDTTGFGFSLRYELIQNLELGLNFFKGDFDRQGDGIQKYSCFSYGPDVKINIPYGWAVFENKSWITPYLRYQRMTWDQSVTEVGTVVRENSKDFKAQSNNYSIGIQIGAADGSFKFYSEFKRIQFSSGDRDFRQTNSNAFVVGLGGEF